jgi:hypothetical protein
MASANGRAPIERSIATENTRLRKETSHTTPAEGA